MGNKKKTPKTDDASKQTMIVRIDTMISNIRRVLEQLEHVENSLIDLDHCISNTVLSDLVRVAGDALSEVTTFEESLKTIGHPSVLLDEIIGAIRSGECFVRERLGMER